VHSKFLKSQSLLLSLIPLFLISGPLLPEVALSTIAVFTTIYILKKKQYQFFHNKFFLFFLIFYFYLLINSFFINPTFDSIKNSLLYFRFGLFSICFWYLLEQDKLLFKKIFFVILFCFSILIIDGYIQFFFKANIFDFKISETKRISSFFNDELILGSYLSRLFPIFFGLTILLFHKKKKILILVSVIFILADTMIFLSGERASLFYMNLSAIYIILCIKYFKKLRIVTLMISLTLIAIISITNPTYKERVIDKTASQMGISLEKNDKKYIFSKEHTDHYLSAKKMFDTNILFGVGVRNFKNLCDRDEFKVSNVSCSTHPHNTYVQLLAETGIIGFTIIFGFLLYLFKITLSYLFYSPKKANYLFDFEVCIVSAMIISLWPLIPNGNFFNNWLSVIYYMPIGIYLWSNKNNKKT
jgi:O-antigen ligase